ncbi:MAG: hypothetical protein WCR70_09360 [Sphaerochaetaceae bacterium]
MQFIGTARFYCLEERQARLIVEQVRDIVSLYPGIAKDLGISSSETRSMSPAFRL